MPLPSLSVTFEGVMSTAVTSVGTTGNDTDGGSFTSPNQRITRTLMATQNPGLLTVKTTGSTVRTIGTLDADADTTNGHAAMDEGSGGNFEIVSPIKASTTYYVYVDGQTRNESGDFGLKVEFKVAVDLGQDAYEGTIATNNFDPDQSSDYAWGGLLLFYFS